MKCPSCGFVTFPDPAQCKKCGHRFEPDARRSHETARSVTFRSPDRQPALTLQDPPAREGSSEPLRIKPAVIPGPVAQTDSGDLESHEERAPEVRVVEPGVPSPWHEEIAARVARYRRKHGLEVEASKPNFEFDFDTPLGSGSAAERSTAGLVGEAELRRGSYPDDVDLDVDSEVDAGEVEATPVDHCADSTRGDNPSEWALEPLDFRASDRPVEIVLHSGQADEDAGQRDDPAPRVASLGRRFVAGIVDILILLLAAGTFFVLFRASGGQIDRQPATLVVLGLAGAVLVTFYFSIFTALAFATPGQAAAGLRVRTFDGEVPDVRSSLWRGTGYLVSGASLMLGFAWAAFDPEHLAWHDHMSRTCLVERR